MRALRPLVSAWLPVAAWMALIFAGSTATFSSGHTSRIIGPFLRWLVPGLADAALESAVVFIRKSAHVTEYAVLAALWWRALWAPVRRDPRPPWSWPVAGWALLASARGPPPTRSTRPSPAPAAALLRDVALDTAGAALGLLLVWRVRAWRAGR